MKKHILGFAIFGFIFALFAGAFAYFYAPPIPQVAEVKQPVYQSEPQSSCRKRGKKSNDLQYEVISSQYHYNQNQIVSRIKLFGNNSTELKKINVVAKFASTGRSPKIIIDNSKFFESHIFDSDSNIITVVSKLDAQDRFDRKKNLYAYFTIFDENSQTNDPNTFVSIDATPVVFVHDGKFTGSGYGWGSGSGAGTPRIN